MVVLGSLLITNYDVIEDAIGSVKIHHCTLVEADANEDCQDANIDESVSQCCAVAEVCIDLLPLVYKPEFE